MNIISPKIKNALLTAFVMICGITNLPAQIQKAQPAKFQKADQPRLVNMAETENFINTLAGNYTGGVHKVLPGRLDNLGNIKVSVQKIGANKLRISITSIEDKIPSMTFEKSITGAGSIPLSKTENGSTLSIAIERRLATGHDGKTYYYLMGRGTYSHKGDSGQLELIEPVAKDGEQGKY